MYNYPLNHSYVSVAQKRDKQMKRFKNYQIILLALTFYYTSAHALKFSCSSPDIPAQYLPSSCNASSSGITANNSNGQYYASCSSGSPSFYISCPGMNTYKPNATGVLSNGGTISPASFQNIYNYNDATTRNLMTEASPQPTLTKDGETINLDQYCPAGTRGIIAKDNYINDYMIACK